MNKDMPQDPRTQTLALVNENKPGDAAPEAATLIAAWIAALDEEDLTCIDPHALSAVLWQAFPQVVRRAGPGCRIAQVRHGDGRRGMATALLILNDDMPYLVDSFVMALRRRRVVATGVMNAVLPVRRDEAGKVAAVGEAAGGADTPLESYVLCLLAEDLAQDALADLVAHLEMVANDAAVVHRDAVAMLDRMTAVAAAALEGPAADPEVAAFLDWAKNEGFEPFGYAYYTVKPGQRELERDLPSRIGVLQDTAHPVYGTCLANIPGDYELLSRQGEPLSIVKADVAGTLHRDQPLDFIGVRALDAQGNTIGEHCFVGLFTRAAILTRLARLPFARGRVARVLAIAGVRQEGFRAEKFLEIMESLPRTEALEADPEWLAQVCSAVVSLYKQPRAKVFARRDVYGRHLNVLVYLPRERYSGAVVAALAQALKDSSGATDVRSQTLVADGPLARVYLIAQAARNPLDLASDIQKPLLSVLDGWHDRFSALTDAVADIPTRNALRKLLPALPVNYVAGTVPEVAFRDLKTLLANGVPEHVSVRLELGDPEVGDEASIRLYTHGSVPSLSRILPALQNAGVAIDREQSFWLKLDANDPARHYVTALIVDADTAAKLVRPGVAEVATELFTALFNGAAEDGRLNGLVIDGGLSVREVQLVRAYLGYWRQAGSKFTTRYMAETLRLRAGLVKELVEGFLLRFDPSLPPEQHAAGDARLAGLKAGLAQVNHADTEEIMAALVDLVLATVRTNWFQNTDEKIIFKFDTSGLALVPEPRPFREIYVFSRRFEGVHLRGGPVARGGLRWSDRMEDYRTEVLGLVKAQMVKNAVIVPVGSKGGFVCKQMPKDATRDVVAAEGQAVYRLFVSSLLEVTDNRVQGEIVPPPDTVRYDADDPYLVVAADKGTASFSDIANGIATSRGFWLGDAFASGGSHGYDHKKMGITAKGAFEAVKRHFYEMGHDMNATPITAIGVGDMSGDVFGNGMLLSRQIKLVAAFDHRHVFLDPNPDVIVSFNERKRLFALPRSSWDDYDKDLISEGGGVFPRSARSIALTPQVRTALGIEEESLAPDALLHRILRAPVDLFYNGGIGTYIKASTESHAQVKDRANDAVRVDGRDLRCKVVAEGGNLGATQAGRIEYALAGGRIFTDAIDNSAGVDCSDHEVNVKIWLDTEVRAGQLDEIDRNRLLTAMTGDIEKLVLRDNTLQTHLLVREVQAQAQAQGANAGATVDGYAALIAALEAEGAVSRDLEQLPHDAELQRRKTLGTGLTAPELAVVVANVKNRYKRVLATGNLLGQPWAATILRPYFPPQLTATRDPLAHPLANAILATVLANEAVNRCGPLMLRDLALEHRVDEAGVIEAWGRAWATLHLAPVFEALDADALNVPRDVSQAVDARTRVMLRTVIEGVLSLPAEQAGAGGMHELANLFAQPEQLRQLMPARSDADGHAGLPSSFAQAWRAVDTVESLATFLFTAVSVQRPQGMSLADFLQVGMRLRAQAGIDALEQGLKLPAAGKAQEQLRNYALQALRRTQQRLLTEVLARIKQHGDTDAAVRDLTAAMGLSGDRARPTDLEGAMLDVWALSEGSNPERLAAA